MWNRVVWLIAKMLQQDLLSSSSATGSRFLKEVATHLPDYTASHPEKPWSSQLWKSKITQNKLHKSYNAQNC